MRLDGQFIGQAVGVMLLRRRGERKPPFQMWRIRCRGADDDRMGVALLADRGDEKMGIGGDRTGSAWYLIRAERCGQWPV